MPPGVAWGNDDRHLANLRLPLSGVTLLGCVELVSGHEIQRYCNVLRGT